MRLPVRGRKDPVELDSRKLPGKVTAGPAAGVNPKDYDLVGLAMQEPQYRSPGVRELLDAVGKSRVPCMSIMNMPPLPYIKRIPGLDYEALKPAYTDPSVWDSFDPATITLNSPDPQAIRPPDEKVNVLMVTLPTNFKVARFNDEKSTAMLRQLQEEIEAIKVEASAGGGMVTVQMDGQKRCLDVKIDPPAPGIRAGAAAPTPSAPRSPPASAARPCSGCWSPTTISPPTWPAPQARSRSPYPFTAHRRAVTTSATPSGRNCCPTAGWGPPPRTGTSPCSRAD